MRIKEARISKQVTHNLGNMEFVRMGVELTGDINADEDSYAAINELSVTVTEQLRSEFREFLLSRKEKNQKSLDGPAEKV